jgi:hypothetical protein
LRAGGVFLGADGGAGGIVELLAFVQLFVVVAVGGQQRFDFGVAQAVADGECGVAELLGNNRFRPGQGVLLFWGVGDCVMRNEGY